MNENIYKIIKKGQVYMIPYDDGWEKIFEKSNEIYCTYVIKRKSFTNFVVTFEIFNKTKVYSDFTIPIDNMFTIEKIFVEKRDQNKQLTFLSILPDNSKHTFLKQFGINFSTPKDLSSFLFIVKAIQKYYTSN